MKGNKRGKSNLHENKVFENNIQESWQSASVKSVIQAWSYINYSICSAMGKAQ